MNKVRVAVIGAGAFGRNHARVIRQIEDVELSAVVDIDIEKARDVAREYGSRAFPRVNDVSGPVDAAILATPTVTHEPVATYLLETGIDVLIEKPIAESSFAGDRLAHLAQERGRILQVGHLERFNPAVIALRRVLTIPLFFEIHRLSIFTPRSLDIDVILDLMIHDLDIVLSFTQELPDDIHAAGISVLSPRVDIANVRLSFPSG
ncbi:MAG: Gfo/Idh/MocA family oxidoreductase, partial [Acidobacteriaceae bacterium]|nr:Gfo/Idh/MocA family oxidoreductase [Acidobacteriaceae bacterium]